jgi:hypothetical protein
MSRKAMFTIGQKYAIRLQESGSQDAVTVQYHWEVVEVQDTLVKLRRDDKELILNTASPLFHSAEPQS